MLVDRKHNYHDIDGFPGWVVSSEGHVMSEWSERKMAVGVNQQGIAMVRLQQDRRQHARSLARLVADAYLDPPEHESYDSIIHLNGDKTDCRAINLMWRPRWFTIRYHWMFKHDPYRVGVKVPAIGRSFSSLRDMCTTFGLIEQFSYVALINRDPVFHYGWTLERIPD